MESKRTEVAKPSDPVLVELAGMVARLAALAQCPAAGDDATRIDRLAVLERARAAVAAAQYAEMVAFGRSQVDAHIRAGSLEPADVGRGVADQIGLACRISPWSASRLLGVARDLSCDLPATAGLLATGRISDDLARAIVAETRHLDPEPRRLVDVQLVPAGVEHRSRRAAEALVRRLAYEADRAAYVDRGRTRRAERRVGLRPAPDTMSVLCGFLPVEQGVACLAALRTRTDAVVARGDGRTRDQIMADTMVERITGQVAAADVPVEVGIVMPLDALLDPGRHGSAEVSGYGSIPAEIAVDILASTRGRRWWRRLFTRTHGGPLVDCDPSRRRFDGVLAHLVELRDGGRCRDPYCDAPIRHLDHVTARRAGGPTTLVNGRGVCARGNYVREMPGWRVEVVEDGLGSAPHTVATRTPTGHLYLSHAPPGP